MEDTIEIDGTEYRRTGTIQSMAVNTEGLEYCIVRARNSGVHAGYLKGRVTGTGEVTLVLSRRLWKWHGRTLSGMAPEFHPSMQGIREHNQDMYGITITHTDRGTLMPEGQQPPQEQGPRADRLATLGQYVLVSMSGDVDWGFDVFAGIAFEAMRLDLAEHNGYFCGKDDECLAAHSVKENPCPMTSN